MSLNEFTATPGRKHHAPESIDEFAAVAAGLPPSEQLNVLRAVSKRVHEINASTISVRSVEPIAGQKPDEFAGIVVPIFRQRFFQTRQFFQVDSCGDPVFPTEPILIPTPECADVMNRVESLGRRILDGMSEAEVTAWAGSDLEQPVSGPEPQ